MIITLDRVMWQVSCASKHLFQDTTPQTANMYTCRSPDSLKSCLFIYQCSAFNLCRVIVSNVGKSKVLLLSRAKHETPARMLTRCLISTSYTAIAVQFTQERAIAGVTFCRHRVTLKLALCSRESVLLGNYLTAIS